MDRALRHAEFNFFYAGDTAYSADFQKIGAKLGPFDLAVIPIGGYAPRSLFKHVHCDPKEAVQIHQDIRSQKSIGVHWGTFLITDEPVTEPPEKLVEALKSAQIPLKNFVPGEYGRSISVLGSVNSKKTNARRVAW